MGAPSAVLVAEELFASGCKLVVSVTSAGQILPVLRLAHVTNCMARTEGNFEKGEAEGSVAVLGLLGRLAGEWRRSRDALRAR